MANCPVCHSDPNREVKWVPLSEENECPECKYKVPENLCSDCPGYMMCPFGGSECHCGSRVCRHYCGGTLSCG